jgi:hypothetical protein
MASKSHLHYWQARHRGKKVLRKLQGGVCEPKAYKRVPIFAIKSVIPERFQSYDLSTAFRSKYMCHFRRLYWSPKVLVGTYDGKPSKFEGLRIGECLEDFFENFQLHLQKKGLIPKPDSLRS